MIWTIFCFDGKTSKFNTVEMRYSYFRFRREKFEENNQVYFM